MLIEEGSKKKPEGELNLKNEWQVFEQSSGGYSGKPNDNRIIKLWDDCFMSPPDFG